VQRSFRAISGREVQKKKVVIVGGSFAGLKAHSLLSVNRDLDVTLVNSLDYFEYTPGILRCFVDPDHYPSLHAKIQPNRGRILVGTATSVESSHVEVQRASDGQEESVSFDYCVIAAGASYEGSIKPDLDDVGKEQRQMRFKDANRELRGSQKVVIVGGGLVGVELAAEIATALPSKSIALVDRSQMLCKDLPPFARKYIASRLSTYGVTLQLGIGVASIGDKSVVLQDGTKLSADVVYECRGSPPRSSVVQKLCPDALNKRGAVEVSDTLQVVGKENIFAIGDVMHHTTTDEVKNAYMAEQNADLVAMNIQRMAAGKPLLKYPDALVGRGRTNPNIINVSLGKYDGCLVFNNLVLTGILSAIAKWLIEFTMVRRIRNAPVGYLFWDIAEPSARFISNWILGPSGPLLAHEKAL